LQKKRALLLITQEAPSFACPGSPPASLRSS